MPVDRILQGKQIAEKLGCSAKTVSRLYHADKLPGAFKLGRTSPIKITAKNLDRFKKAKG